MAYLRDTLARVPESDLAWEPAVKEKTKAPASINAVLGSGLSAAVPDELLHRGVVNVIGLEAVKAKTGERWEKSRATVYSRLEAILQRKLGPSDFFTRLNDTAYLISMPGAEREESRICCLGIALDLHVGLFGSCDLGEIKIFAGLPGGGDSITLEEIAPSEVAHLARKSGLHTAFGAHAPAPARGAMNQAAGVDRADSGYTFWPLWDARKEAVIGYRCVPPGGETALENPATVQLKARTELKQVIATLMHATGMLAKHLQRGERFLMAVPMTYEALSCPLTRMEIAAACRDLPAELRAYLLFEIVDAPRGVPNSKLAEFATILKPFCKALIVHTPFRSRTPAGQANTPVHALALTLPNLRISANEARGEIERLRDESKRLGCMSVLSNVTDPDLFRFAISRGISLVSGSVIGKRTAPAPMHRMPADEILQRAGRRTNAPRSATIVPLRRTA